MRRRIIVAEPKQPLDLEALTSDLVEACRPHWQPESAVPARQHGDPLVLQLQAAMLPTLRRHSIVELATIHGHLRSLFNGGRYAEDTLAHDAVFWAICLIAEMVPTARAASLADARARLELVLGLGEADGMAEAIEHAIKHDLGRAWRGRGHTTVDPDARIIAAAKEWQELEVRVRRLLAKRAQQRKLVPDYLRDAVETSDPRGFVADEASLTLWGEGYVARMVAYQPIFAKLGLGEIEDELAALWTQQEPLSKFLTKEAIPQTAAGALAIVGVALAFLGQDQFLDDPVRDPDNDWDVEFAVAGRDALAHVTRLLAEGLPEA